VDIDEQRALVEAARQGGEVAWERLYRNVYPRLRAYAVTLVGTEVAEDAVNETMARAVARIARFKWEGGGFDAWLFGILRRVGLETHRRNLSARRGVTVEARIDHARPEDEFEAMLEHEAVRRAFANLSEVERDILALRLFSGLSSEDVARLLGKSPGAVRTAQSRALADLRTLMRQQS
jgi:RNA polymerase sigma-70 factor (ECF subfamily)